MSNDTHAQGFGMVPNWLVRESTVSAYALLVYVALSSRTNRNGECWPSIRTIAKEARCSESTARRAVNELRDVGILTTSTRKRRSDGGQTSNIYRVLVGIATRPKVAFEPESPLSDGLPPAARGTGQEEYPVEQESNANLKPTLTSVRHSDSHTASEAQVTFLADCFILLHDALPDYSDYGRWELLTSAEAHDEIRSYWSEIEQGADDLLSDAITSHRANLSPRAINYITNRLAIA